MHFNRFIYIYVSSPAKLARKSDGSVGGSSSDGNALSFGAGPVIQVANFEILIAILVLKFNLKLV